MEADEENSLNESIESTFEDMNEFNDVTEQPINSDTSQSNQNAIKLLYFTGSGFQHNYPHYSP